MIVPITRTAASLLTAAMLTTFVSTVTAHADTSEFLTYLQKKGIAYGDPNATAQVGVNICNQFNQGASFKQVQATVQTLPGGTSLDQEQSVIVVAAAIHTMCPQYWVILPQ